MAQFALPLAFRAADGERDFYVSEANADAVAQLDRWPDWPGRVLALVGPEASGKSHLARIFGRRAGHDVRIVDPADTGAFDDEALFHAWNSARAGDGPGLLLIGRTAPSQWVKNLPDLRSRLRDVAVARIGPPDDALLAELIAKQFKDRGLVVSPKVLMYMVPRIERSFPAVSKLVQDIDQAALADKRSITIPLVRSIIEAVGR